MRPLSYVIAFSLLLANCTSISVADEPRQPNIVIVLVDDMGYSDLGCYGSEIETPNIDRLAANGLRFTQFYNSGRCCPTRASLMTGLHPHQVGIGHMTEPPERSLGVSGAYQGFLNDRCVTLAQVLKSAGYHTLMTGKWHLGYHSENNWPLQRGFDRFFGGISGGFNYFQPTGNRGMTDGNLPVTTGEGFYATDAFTDVACQYISDSLRADDKPFFLYLAYNAPHWPLNAKPADFEKYKGQYRHGWSALMQTRLAKQKSLGLWEDSLVPAPHVGPTWDSLTDKQRDDLDSIMAAYAGCIDSIDQNIGKLTEHLQRLGQLDNTLILFLSDNGACQEGGTLGQGDTAMVYDPPANTAGVRLGLAWANACNTPFRLYKHFLHEGGASTPMIAHWPDVISENRRGQFVREFAYLPDFMATCLDLSGAEYPADIPACVGKSLVSALEGEQGPIHTEPVYWEHEGNAAMRWGNWKLVREYKKPWELFDLAVDRTEMNNLATEQADKRSEMIAMWEVWATEHQVSFPERFNMYDHLNALKKAENATEPKE
ncbi:MAG: arylsulfatase [Planctomycetales bacterium]|nr:arylsulfatase [Planctomycetales bacterium]